ncbi:MAG: radical SAM protein [Thermodesulfobacteriota bacterium]
MTLSDYSISRFTLAEPLPGGRTALFNTLTQALAVVPAEVWAEATAGAQDPSLEDLAAEGFLVETGLDEDLVLAHWRASQAYDLSHLTYIVSPTRACNMACSYCVHGSKKRAEHMSLDTAQAVLEFISADLETKRPLDVRLDFGGAEPLVNPRVVFHLSETLAAICRRQGLGLRISLITNGLALDPDLVTGLKPFGLGRIRVTVSGPAEVHDRCRPAKDGGPTYGRILSNLERVAGMVEIGLTGQYNPEQGEHLRFPELLADLAARGLRDHLNDVSFGPVVPVDPAEILGPPRTGETDCLKDEDPGRVIWLQDQVTKRGFKTASGPPANRCLANYRNSLIIDPDGRFIVCPSMMDYPDLEYGGVHSGVDFRREARLLARNLPEECRRRCVLAPLCDGGCRHQALIRTGNFDGVNCLRWSYEHLTRAYVRQAAYLIYPPFEYFEKTAAGASVG